MSQICLRLYLLQMEAHLLFPALSVGDTVGSAVMSVAGGTVNFNTNLIVSSIISSNQAILQSINISNSLSLGTFTISNSNAGISIIAQSIPDGNNVTAGNSSSVTFNNIFINPGPGILTFTSTINSELGGVDVQNFPFTIACLCLPTTSNISAIECDNYSWNGTTYTTSGVYTFATINSNGCDSTATLNLTINPSTISTANVTECDTYSWNGTTYTASGTYTHSTTNANGCDSTATLNLTINISITVSNSAAICIGDSVFVGNSIYTSAGIFIDTLQTLSGCDSTITTIVSISVSGCTDPTALNYDPLAICDDGSCIAVVYGCMDILACNYYAGANVSDSSCVYATTSTANVTECNTYSWNGTAYTTSGVYTFVTTNSNGCDSTATLNLTINPSTTVDVLVVDGLIVRFNVAVESQPLELVPSHVYVPDAV